MPRRARLDAPGTLHHVIVRGIDKRFIVDDDKDRENFVMRMGELTLETKTSVYAWALMTNHAHILLRSGPDGISGRGIKEKGDERILDSGEFVEKLIDEAERKTKQQFATSELLEKAKAAMDAYCHEHDIQMKLIRSGSRMGSISKHRAKIVIMLVTETGLSMAETGRQLGLSTSGVAQILRRR